MRQSNNQQATQGACGKVLWVAGGFQGVAPHPLKWGGTNAATWRPNCCSKS